MYLEGKGVKQNYLKAKEFFSNACASSLSKHGANGCYELAKMYNEGKGVKQNYSIAKKIYDKACYMGNSNGCNKRWTP